MIFFKYGKGGKSGGMLRFEKAMKPQISGAAFPVGRRHTFAYIDNADYRIPIEADFIADASENGYGKKHPPFSRRSS